MRRNTIQETGEYKKKTIRKQENIRKNTTSETGDYKQENYIGNRRK